MLVTANDGVELYVEVHGDGDPVLLIHGWPDSADVWRHQVPALTDAGYRVITPDLRGFARSGRPQDVKSYRLANSVADMGAVLEAAGAPTAHVVGHDWGSAVAWATAMFLPARVRTLTAISVPHLGVPDTPRQREMAWYTLFFQFEEVAEAQLMHDDWALLRELLTGYKDIERAIANLSRPGALTATLNWYRANVAPRMPGPRRELPPVLAPTMGAWSDGSISPARGPAASRTSAVSRAISSRPMSGPCASVTMSALSAASLRALGPPAAISTGVWWSPSRSRSASTACPICASRWVPVVGGWPARLTACSMTSGRPVPIPNSNRPPDRTDTVCASQAASCGGRSGLAATNVPTCSVVVAPAAIASAGSDDSNCMPSGISSVE